MDSFRNHFKTQIKFNPGLNILWGQNGSGKTSVLEAIHTLSFGKSFKTSKHQELLTIGDELLTIKGNFSQKETKETVTLHQNKKGERRFRVGDKRVFGLKDLIGKNPVVVLSPEEQAVTKGAPAQRRQFFNKMFSSISRPYAETLVRYHKILKQRNAALIQIRDKKEKQDSLKIWDEHLSQEAISLWKKRQDLFNQYNKELKKVLEGFSDDEKLNLEYQAPTLKKNTFLQKLNKTTTRDITTGQTNAGPHRDDFNLIWDTKNLKKLGSQGEHKITLILLKLAELFFIATKTKTTPTLLLDDLFAKLDSDRSQKIVKLIKKFEQKFQTKIQTIITTTDLISLEKSGIDTQAKNTKTLHLKRTCNA